MSKPNSRSFSEGNRRSKRTNSLMAYLLQDTSIDKATSDKTKADRMIMAVSNQEGLLKGQRHVRHITQKRRQVQEIWEKTVQDEITRYYNNKVNCDKAALAIQKIVRGFLVRIKIEPMLLEIREINTEKVVQELRIQTDICMLSLGTNTIPAIKLIQAAYRRYEFRKKLIIMRKCYELYLRQREEMICDFLRKAFLNYSCKIQRDHLAFLRYRVIRLEQIKENIAILTVKKIWRAKKLSFKIVKEKFIRIKRRKAAMQNKEAYQKYLASLGGPNPAPKNQKKIQESGSKDSKNLTEGKAEDGEGEKLNNPEDDEEYKEAQRIKEIIDRKIKEKVATGKLAYAIPDRKDKKMILPMMQEKALNEPFEEEGIKSKLFYITLSNFAKGRSLSRESRPMTRNLNISTPKELNQRRHYDIGIPLPRLSLLETANVPLIQSPPLIVTEVEHAHFLLPTTASANRTEEPVQPSWRAVYHKASGKKHKRIKLDFNIKNEGEERTTRPIQVKERVNHWIPVARRFSTYVLGLDNSAYTQYKWTPLKLDKRILHTANPNAYSRKRRNSQSPSFGMNMNDEAITYNMPNYVRKDMQVSISPSTQDRSMDFVYFS
ncbi:hypothetical protein SteCoe_33777 [Stentor coeruleus]|uniref:Uncharacterized protein n=1 Tax=Stentor coeruleus TaxID=5963 RepID=A0A1R2AW84_9CILI|nr:hypothetical protein SteCoe_33777 [Stentor coeruleus]